MTPASDAVLQETQSSSDQSTINNQITPDAEWAPLYHRAATGKIHSWKLSVIGDTIVVVAGQIDGAKITHHRKAEPKNVGRSNETTPTQQAILEASAMHKFKLDRKYSLTVEEAHETVRLPMLAQYFDKCDKKLTYPVDVQPKLDGVRALARWEGDKVVLTSRSGKPWLFTQHINRALEKRLPKDTVLDGEIYVHDWGFQRITAATKKYRPDTNLLQYHVYDIPEVDGDDTLIWSARRDALSGFFSSITGASPLWMVPSVSAQDKDHVKDAHDMWVKSGYEGAMVRVIDGLYEYGHKSWLLLKVKMFDDAEFEIIKHGQENNTRQGLVTWTCRNDLNDLAFDVRPRGTHEDRMALFLEAESYYGEKLKVRFFGRTDDGLPRFPVGVGIRASEDQD